MIKANVVNFRNKCLNTFFLQMEVLLINVKILTLGPAVKNTSLKIN